MEGPIDLSSLMASGRHLRAAGEGIYSTLPEEEEGAPWDRRAARYDRLVCSPAYNRIAWGTNPSEYRRFTREAVESGEGPFLEAGCGTAAFTAEALEIVDPDAAIPIHYEEYTVMKSPLVDFDRAVARRRIRTQVHRLERGGTFSFTIGAS